MKHYAANPSEAVLVDAIDFGLSPRAGACSAVLGQHLKLSTDDLASYFFSGWKPDLADLLVVAAAIEFCDFLIRRPAWGWSRAFDVRVAVHSPALWNRPDAVAALTEAVGFLTGDLWRFSFVERASPMDRPKEMPLDLGGGIEAVIPYSNGLDSRAVAILSGAGSKLVRVRLGSAPADEKAYSAANIPFKAVPFKVRLPHSRRRESSARSRGFKFAAITAIAANLSGATSVIVTESGQGALGPTLAVSGQGYPDYRVHPAFMMRMQRLIQSLYGGTVSFAFPRIWSTKGQTLQAAAELAGAAKLAKTRSCWQQARQVGYDGRLRQCGVCAACMLRRMSMHAAGLPEEEDAYLYSDRAADLQSAGPIGFAPPTSAMQHYAVAGILHLDHLAEMSGSMIHQPALRRAGQQAAAALNMGSNEAVGGIDRLLSRHAEEWRAYRRSLPAHSFVNAIAQAHL